MSKTPEDLKQEIEAAKASAEGGGNNTVSNKSAVPASGVRMALRAATDMVAALVVGGGLGYGIDKWLGTKPWFMIIMFFLGAIAGFVNIYRSQTGQEYKVGLGSLDSKDKDGEN